MGEQTFRDYIFHGAEERNIEYKRSISWKETATKNKVLIAALALANTQDGGVIVFGVDEDKANDAFTANGMIQSHADSFRQDNISDYVNSYADPFIEIKVNKEIYDNKIFIIIQVAGFQEIPIICRKDNDEVKRGDIFVRSKDKHESTRVKSQNEMREILDRAADRIVLNRIEIYKQLKTKIEIDEVSDKEQFDNQLGGL